ncbi:MAG: ECF transporter S component [Oscillospiraceae bacterium]|nr:ECF transporter S component [Oscillospiraceae bacterium]
MPMSKAGTHRVAKMAMMTAIAVVFSFIPSFPILPSADFIRYEFSDLPILISVFAFGTPAGLAVAAVSILINALLGGAESAVYGMIMHFLAIGAYSAAAGLIYRSDKSRKGAIIGLVAGILAMTVIMIPANLFVTPAFMGAPVSVIKGMLIPAIIPINLIKGAITAVLTLILYKRVSGFLHK